jgi:hypothetical protein
MDPEQAFPISENERASLQATGDRTEVVFETGGKRNALEIPLKL